MQLESWGRYPRTVQQSSRALFWRDEEPFRPPPTTPVLPYGQGRSYGDACLCEGGTLLATRGLDRFIHFDDQAGVLRCEAGVTLAAILELVVPRGWFLPVVPGTKHVSVGGAIANDIHGKNHHRAGTFGAHLRRFELLRSSGERLECAPGENAELFAATIGGLGLTGLVTWAELQLKPIVTRFVQKETIPFGGLDEFFRISAASDAASEYTVAWVDCLARGKHLGRGLFYRGDHAVQAPLPTGRADAPAGRAEPVEARRGPGLRVPFDLPSWTLNRFTVGAFNKVYDWSGRRHRQSLVAFDPFFFPLDGVREWNRIYGPEGLLQFQCVVPHAVARDAIRDLLQLASAAGTASFLAVLKRFGDVPSPGLLSFPRPGVTLAMDFANRGEETFALFARFEAVVRQAGGAMYPAKDARMTRDSFAAFYPRLDEFRKLIDPAFSSSFWRRVAA